MAYLLTKARYNNKVRHFIVDQGKVISQRDHIDHLNMLKMSCQSFEMAAGKVHFSSKYYNLQSHTERKNFFITLQKQGYTTLVVSYKVSYLKQLEQSLKKAKHELINSSLDYIIGITINISQLTPGLIRACLRFKVPFIIVEMAYDGFDTKIPWEWVRNQNFPIPVCIIPSWLDDTIHSRKKQKQAGVWTNFAHYLNIHTTESLGVTLTLNQLKALGIYPRKGVIHPGSDLDYNLFYHPRDSIVDVQSVSHYHSDNPNIVTLRGKVMKVNDTIYFRPGFGQQIKSAIPGRFSNLLKYEGETHC